MCLSRTMETISVRRAYKTELEPTEAQIGALVHHCGSARWAYNWGLQRKLDARANGQRVPNAIALHRELVVLKRTTYPWLSDVSKCAPQEALRDLDRAFANYRAGRRGRKVWRAPRFKSRRRGLGTFRFSQGVKVAERAVWLPRAWPGPAEGARLSANGPSRPLRNGQRSRRALVCERHSSRAGRCQRTTVPQSALTSALPPLRRPRTA